LNRWRRPMNCASDTWFRERRARTRKSVAANRERRAFIRWSGVSNRRCDVRFRQRDVSFRKSVFLFRERATHDRKGRSGNRERRLLNRRGDVRSSRGDVWFSKRRVRAQEASSPKLGDARAILGVTFGVGVTLLVSRAAPPVLQPPPPRYPVVHPPSGWRSSIPSRAFNWRRGPGGLPGERPAVSIVCSYPYMVTCPYCPLSNASIARPTARWMAHELTQKHGHRNV
jgi:hypothetical protein